MINKIKETIDFIRTKTNVVPENAIILGSGLGKFADHVKDATVINYTEIPHFNSTAVAGHKGCLIIGMVNERPCAVLQGRIHSYEGHSLDEVVYATRVMKHLGAKNLILTNAAGGINKDYKPGDLVIIDDHINLTGRNPLIGKNIDELGPRFPDMTFAYDKDLRQIISNAATSINFKIHNGIYAAMTGPSYETPAEIEMLRTIGADMVGMSTVFESIAGNHAGLKVAGISCITNMAAGIDQIELKHEDIKEEANKSIDSFCKILEITSSKL